MTAPGPTATQRLVEGRPANVLRRLRSGCGRVPTRLARAALGRGRRVIHGLDVTALGLLMEIVARVTERKLLSLVERPSPDVAAGDQCSSSPQPTAR